MTQYNKPLPEVTILTEPFWEGTKQHELRLQRCDNCLVYRFTPKDVCPMCASVQTTWVPVSGAGAVYSYSVVHRGPGPGFQEDAPYIVVMVDLAEGPRIPEPYDGMRARRYAGWYARDGRPSEDVTPEVTLYKFRPI